MPCLHAVGDFLFAFSIAIWVTIGSVFLAAAVHVSISPDWAIFVEGVLGTALALGGWYMWGDWPAFCAWAGWEAMRTRVFKFVIAGDETGIDLMQRTMAHPVGTVADHERIIWAINPHGFYPCTAIFWWALNPAWGHAVGSVHSSVFYAPILGHIARWMGVTGSTERDIRNALERHGQVYMAPGGLSDVGLSGTKVRRHRGFLRIAHATRTTVVPIWCPAERHYFRAWFPLGRRLERWLGYPIPIIIVGRWWAPLWPRAVPGRSPIVVGKPITWGGSADSGPPRSLAEGEAQYWHELERIQKLYPVPVAASHGDRQTHTE